MDWPLRTRLIVGFVGMALVSAVLTVPAGSILISRMVVAEAQRRVDLALNTADDMLGWQLQEQQRSASDVAKRCGPVVLSSKPPDCKWLSEFCAKRGYDFLHMVDPEGHIIGTPCGDLVGQVSPKSAVLSRALAGEEASGVSLLPLTALAREAPALAARACIDVLPTPHAKPGGAGELNHAMVLEAALPIFDDWRRLRGVVRLGTVINGNFDFVDLVQKSVFTAETYKSKNIGTVTIFQNDVRVATNVLGPDGRRAVGTRVSAEVYDQVLGEGKLWTGPAFVVDSWYISAYEPLRDLDGDILGMLYVGVLKARYDDMRGQAMRLFLGIALLAIVVAAFLSNLVASRMTRRLDELMLGATQVAQGNLDYKLASSPKGKRYEITRLAVAFDQMVRALRERDEQLRASNVELQRTADELQEWVRNYLDILEFITHELKNQIAAMTINLLAVRDGYVGEISDEQREALDDVAVTIERSQEMILNYLNLSRIEKGELEVHARPLQVGNDIVRPVLRDLRAALENHGARVEMDLPEELMVDADPSLMRIVYSNLLSNAVKYGLENGCVRLFGQRVGDLVELHVWNEGRGVPEDKLDELFQKFFRLPVPRDKLPGTGLGLFITREILLKHGGDIRAESQEGEWIDFILTLPASEAPPQIG